MSGQAEEIRLSGGGAELYARLRTSDQEAPTIVLLCGLGFHTFEYEPLAESLTASGYNALSFDYRGHGRSDGPRGRWSLADLASDARRAVGLVSGRGFERIGLFGNSLGAMIGIQVATADPRVRGGVASNCPAHMADFLLTTPRRMLLTIARPLQMVPAVRISVGRFYSYEQLINDRAWVTRIPNDPTVGRTCRRPRVASSYPRHPRTDGSPATRRSNPRSSSTPPTTPASTNSLTQTTYRTSRTPVYSPTGWSTGSTTPPDRGPMCNHYGAAAERQQETPQCG